MTKEAAVAMLVEACAVGLIWTAGSIAGPMQQECSPGLSAEAAGGGAISSGCTVFTVSKGGRVFFGGNDDYINPDSYYWVDPGGAPGYGTIWIGTPDNVQQGVNARGLAYDANGLPRVDVNPHLDRKPVSGGYSSYPIQILRECGRVEEVIAWVNAHQWHSYMHDQMQFADATGDAVIISAGADGEVVYTRKPRGDGHLVSTNFNVANPANGFGYPCPRYETAQRLLGKLVSQVGELTAQDAANVLNAVHVEGGTSWTIESMVADLPNGVVYLYYFHQFDKPLVLNVMEEIARVRAAGPLSRLFPEEVRQEAARRYQHLQAQESRCRVFGQAWLGLVLTCLAVLLIGSLNRRRGLRFWIPVVVILGPIGLVTWLVAGRNGRSGTGRRVLLVEAAGDVAPTVVAFVLFLVAAISIPAVQTSQYLQVLLIFGLPLTLACLLFQGPLLTRAMRKGYMRTLLQRLPHTWVTANLGMAGINVLAMPLVSRSLRACPVLPLSLWTVAAWWAIVAGTALVGGLVLSAYELWASRCGFRAWSIAASGEGEAFSPPWRRLWWWILMSYVALVGGVAAGVLIQQVFSG